MLGVIVNTLTVVIGSTIGLVAKKAIPAEWTDFIMKGIALCVIYIGISGTLEGENTLVMIISMVLGAVLNVILDPIFIFVFKMGVEGAALATVISQIISFLINILYVRNFK